MPKTARFRKSGKQVAVRRENAVEQPHLSGLQARGKRMKDDAKEHYARERLAKWLLDHGYSTGHGDTFEDLLEELIDQVAESSRQQLLKKLDEFRFVMG